MISGLAKAGDGECSRHDHVTPPRRVCRPPVVLAQPLAESMPQAESAAVLRDFIEHHPAEWKKMQGIFEHVSGRPVDTMPMVRLRVQPRH
jgi:hypothetical protein